MLRIRRGARGGDVTKVALTGDSALELLASYFRDAGFSVMPQDAALDEFKPDYVYDVTSHDEVLSSEVIGFTDERFAALSGSKYSLAGLKAIVEEFEWETLKAPKKILAVDADNTLWRGIISEDGVNAVEPYRVFQAGLKMLRDEGVVLVLLSKNDPFDDRVKVDRSLFAAERVSWAPKAGNLLDACRILNLSPDSVVFVDDNPHERAQMKAHLPEVTIAPFNGFPQDETEAAERQFVRRLKEYFFFDAGKTEEDRLRAADYARMRTIPVELKTRDEYLADLGLYVRPSLACESDLDRLVQMAGKTNQFNATTLRRGRDQFVRLIERKSVFVFRAGDRFGEQGLVAYVVVDAETRRITDFVMSCRAMGRTLEFYALDYVTKALGYLPEIDFTPTAKNKPFRDFLDALARGDTKNYYATAR